MTTGITAGRRFVCSLMNLPSVRRALRRMVSKSVAPVGRGLDRSSRTAVLRLLEERLGLGGVHPALGDDLRAAHDLAGALVDGDDHDDHALLGELAPVAQHALADVADDAVDVEVAGRHRLPFDVDVRGR